MDRSMYGKVDPSEAYQYQPFRLTKKDTPAPGYALLADLQATLHTNGTDGSYGTHEETESYQYQTSSFANQPIYHNQRNDSFVTSSTPRDHQRHGSGRLEELDSLLEDLSSARQSAADPVTEERPSVDSLLDELSAAVGPREEVLDAPQSQKVVPSASSATQELEVLMASLSTFQGGPAASVQPVAVNGNLVLDPAYAKPNKLQRPAPKDQLDSMLGNLQADMNKQGISATQKGCCSACDKPIVGQVITALGRTWHPIHFVCTHCHQELGTKNFFERDGLPYCEADYHNLFSPRCAYCNGPILDKCVTALEQTWHPEHFFCAQCGCQFGEDGFLEKDKKPYCRTDFMSLFAMKCKGCTMAITEGYISALNGQWHPQCFVCRDCNMPFQGGSFFVHEGMPYCEVHYHAKRGSLCAGCNKPVAGRCITAMFKKFHPEHFQCSYCLKQLKKGTFKEHGDKPYCHSCFERLFG